MSNTVEGTFDDLPPEEKTRAFLQFLQYHQQQQQIKETEKFQQLYNGDGTTPSGGDAPDAYSQMDEKVVEESLKIWYGISNGASSSLGVSKLYSVVTIAIASLSIVIQYL